MRRFVFAIALLGAATAASAQPRASWPSLVADRAAVGVGDALTVLIYQDAKASNSTVHGAHRATRLAGAAGAGSGAPHAAQASLTGDLDASGQTSRADQVVAALSVTVTGVLPNGDLRIAGEQALLVNGGRTVIRVSGRVRPADIAADNSVLSSRIADASIVYDGAGFGQRPGLVARVLDRLGVF